MAKLCFAGDVMINCYVLFVKTGREEMIVRKLKLLVDLSLFFPFVPVKEKYFRRMGETVKVREVCFGGYVFIESELFAHAFVNEMSPIFKRIDDVYRIVDYGDKEDIAMRESELLLLRELYGDNYCFEASVGFIEGDRIRVNEGALEGMEYVIKKINRHKREAIIEVELMGTLRRIAVGLEIVKKI